MRYKSKDGRFKFSRCKATFIGYKDQKIIFYKSDSGLSVKFAEHLDKDEVKSFNKTKKHWCWTWEKITDQERNLFGRWLLGEDYNYLNSLREEYED